MLTCDLNAFGKNRKRWGYLQITELPDDCFGVYGIWRRYVPIYVGSAKNQPIRDRLLQHWTKCHNEDLQLWINAFGNELSFTHLILDAKSIPDCEKKLIRHFNPQTNKIMYSNSGNTL